MPKKVAEEDAHLQVLHDAISNTLSSWPADLVNWSNNIKTLSEAFRFKKSKDLPYELVKTHGTPKIWSVIGARCQILALESGMEACDPADVIDIIQQLRRKSLDTALVQRALLRKAVGMPGGSVDDLKSTLGFMGDLAREDCATMVA